MANKTIPDLGQVFTATDLDFLVITNSGETTTSKITRQDLLAGTDIAGGLVNGTGTNSLKSADNLTTNPATASGTNSVAIGNGATSTGDRTIHISNGNLGSTSAGSDSIWIGGGNIYGGNNHIVIGKSAYVGVGGSSNQISIGWETATQGTNAMSIGGSNGGANRAGSNYSMSIGNGNTSNSSVEGVIMGNRNNTQSGSGSGVVSIGTNNTHSSTGGYNTILGGQGSIISGTTSGTTLIGLQNFTSPATNNTTYVDNIHTLRTETFDVIAGGNVGGTIDVDCSLGTIYTFTMTANTTPNFINLRTGQRFIFIIDNTTYNVPAATINGVSGNVYAKNGTISPSSNSITKYTATYDGTRLFLDEEGAFSAI